MEPIETTNLDIYGFEPLAWSRARDLLASSPAASGRPYFLGTVHPDGRPHAAGFGAVWHDDALWLVSGPGTRKSRNLAANPACTVSTSLPGLDLVLEGEAHRTTDAATLEALAAVYRETGWPAQVDGDAFTAPYSAPSAGRPPWHLYRIAFHTVFGVANAEPYGATRWRF
jgi:Pyridoxamine 5'-phosphate oxidase